MNPPAARSATVTDHRARRGCDDTGLSFGAGELYAVRRIELRGYLRRAHDAREARAAVQFRF